MTTQVASLGRQLNLPAGARSAIEEVLQSIVSGHTGAKATGLVLSILLALWSASGGMTSLIKSVNIAYDRTETRNIVKLRALALALTAGAVVFVVLTLGLVAVLPIVVHQLPIGGLGSGLLQVADIALLLLLMLAALGVLYRFAPNHSVGGGAGPVRRSGWVSPGSLVGATAWALGSILFVAYAGHSSSYGKTYGAFAGVAVLLLWLYLAGYAILLGAEVNAVIEVDSGAAPAMVTDGHQGAASGSVGLADTGGRHPRASGRLSPDQAPPRREPMSTDRAARPTTAHPEAAVPPAGELVARLSAQLSTLVRSEVKLASVEVKNKVKPLGIGIGMFAAAAVVGLGALSVLIATAVIALDLLLPLWLAALIVGVALLLVAAILALAGKGLVSRGTPPVPTQTIESVKRDVAVIKGAAHR